MSPLNNTFMGVLCLILFTQCSTSKPNNNYLKTKQQEPIECSRPYFQEWVAALKDGGSGVTIYFPNLVNNNNVTIDSIYFRKMKGKLRNGIDSYFAILKNELPRDLSQVDLSREEYMNIMNKSYSFNLKNNDCMISFIENGEKKYLKIENLEEKAGEYYTSSPPEN